MEPTFKKGFWETGKVFKEQPQNEHQLISDKKYKYETPKNWTYCIGWKKERGLMLYNYVTGRVKLKMDVWFWTQEQREDSIKSWK